MSRPQHTRTDVDVRASGASEPLWTVTDLTGIVYGRAPATAAMPLDLWIRFSLTGTRWNPPVFGNVWIPGTPAAVLGVEKKVGEKRIVSYED